MKLDFLSEDFQITHFSKEAESQEYKACCFQLNSFFIIGRTSKITPKKIGQFVTVWKRNENGITQPFDVSDRFDFFVINAQNESNFGQFVFPKSVLLKQGIVSTDFKGGKRGFRLYPPWDEPKSKQATKTQKWQVEYFLKLNEIDIERAKLLYAENEIR